MTLLAWIASFWAPPEEPDTGYPDSGGFTDRIPLDADCPDTQPSQPGALDDL